MQCEIENNFYSHAQMFFMSQSSALADVMFLLGKIIKLGN